MFRKATTCRAPSLASRGCLMGGWQEAAHGNVIDKTKVYLNGWRSVEICAELAGQGYEMVVNPGQVYYLDMANSADWPEPGAAWAGWSRTSRWASALCSGIIRPSSESRSCPTRNGLPIPCMRWAGWSPASSPSSDSTSSSAPRSGPRAKRRGSVRHVSQTN